MTRQLSAQYHCSMRARPDLNIANQELLLDLGQRAATGSSRFRKPTPGLFSQFGSHSQTAGDRTHAGSELP